MFVQSRGQRDLLALTGLAVIVTLLLSVALGAPAHAQTGGTSPDGSGSETESTDQESSESTGSVDIAAERRLQSEWRSTQARLQERYLPYYRGCSRRSVRAARSCRSTVISHYSRARSRARQTYVEKRLAEGLPRREAVLDRARLRRDGKAVAPVNAPSRVKSVIAWANNITDKPYRYGGGHRRFNDSGYDCSGAISYGLRGGQFLDQPLNSTGFMRWGQRGRGKWITVYTHSGHAYMVVAGLRFDTSRANDPGGQTGPRWRPRARSSSGFMARHPRGY